MESTPAQQPTRDPITMMMITAAARLAAPALGSYLRGFDNERENQTFPGVDGEKQTPVASALDHTESLAAVEHVELVNVVKDIPFDVPTAL